MNNLSVDNAQQTVGKVYLVGAGPGDPELLTIKALNIMQQADVIVYDKLVSPAILALCHEKADKIYVGKSRAQHTLSQDNINALLIDLAKSGKSVCRLKGGDPFIFGRGGEELVALTKSGIECAVVPGITAASGCAASVGIPLTHRDYAQSVRFLAGHLKEDTPELPWHELVYPHQTIVIYMGLVQLKHICQQLMQHGQSAHTPIALIAKGTLPEQQIILGTLENISDKVTQAQISAPTIIIIGEVVNIKSELNHYATELVNA